MSSVKVVSLLGHVTVLNQERQQAAILEHAAPDTHLVLDLTQLEMLNTLALGIILELRKAVEHHRGKLTLVCPDPRLRGVLEHTKIDRLITITRSRDEALNQVVTATEAR